MRRAYAMGLLSALLFGATAPIAKLLLAHTGPLALAGLFYLGAAAATLFVRNREEARLRRSDAPWLLGAVVAGGLAAPALLFLGLSRTPALTASLMLNLEAPFTMLLALLFFGEHLSRREAAGAALVIAAAALLGGARVEGALAGSALVAAACFCWAIDNNCSARLALKDPAQVLRVKAACAGAANLLLGLLVAREPIDGVGTALLTGALGYGASLMLYLRAQRDLGAARQAALFAAAPFAGAALSLPLLGDRPSAEAGIAAVLMALGVVQLARARHAHLHSHSAIDHEHAHLHDVHHQHAHQGPFTEPHSHPHHHDALTHEHAHVSDAHHHHPHKH
jgi:drug/metabolite transporter (DMT)-like permease